MVATPATENIAPIGAIWLSVRSHASDTQLSSPFVTSTAPVEPISSTVFIPLMTVPLVEMAAPTAVVAGAAATAMTRPA